MTMLDSEQSRMINDAVKGLVDSNEFLGVTTWPDLGASVVFPGVYFQGSNYGYASGGEATSIPSPFGFTTARNNVDRYAFPSDGNGTDVLDLGNYIIEGTGASSSTHGYTTGGRTPSSDPEGPRFNIIQKFSFPTNSNYTDVGDLTAITVSASGHSSTTDGFMAGGTQDPATFPTATTTNTHTKIDKFPFSSDTNATDVMSLSTPLGRAAGISSDAYGFSAGGSSTPPNATPTVAYTIIQRFPFSVAVTSSDVGDATVPKVRATGTNSSTNGYVGGGWPPGGISNIIEKFPFASVGTASDIADLNVSRGGAAPASSTTHGYAAGGFASPPPYSAAIDKFPFSSDTNATSVGTISVARSSVAGQQY